MQNSHLEPELWFRPSPILPLLVLLKLVANREITVTPRLGIRDGSHPKGYVPGQRATLRVWNAEWAEVLRRDICITTVYSRPLRDLKAFSLGPIYSAGRAVQHDLSYFEGKRIEENAMVSLVKFDYIA